MHTQTEKCKRYRKAQSLKQVRHSERQRENYLNSTKLVCFWSRTVTTAWTSSISFCFSSSSKFMYHLASLHQGTTNKFNSWIRPLDLLNYRQGIAQSITNAWIIIKSVMWIRIYRMRIRLRKIWSLRIRIQDNRITKFISNHLLKVKKKNISNLYLNLRD